MATEYVILQKDQSGLWSLIRNAGGIEPRTAASARAAIAATPEAKDGGGEFVAVPARSWKPVTVKVETKTALKFS